MLNYSNDDNKNLMETIMKLMELRSHTRKFAPEFKIPIDESKTILKLFEEATELLVPILQNLKILENSNIDISTPSKKIKKRLIKSDNIDIEDEISVKSGTELLELAENKIILLSSNSGKKKLKTLGVNPQFIKSSSGPFFIEDFEKLGKKLPEKAMEGIVKKLEKLFDELKQSITENKKILYVYASDDITDSLNLKRVTELQSLLGENLEFARIDSWTEF